MNLLFLGAVANNPSPTATPHLSFRKPLKLGEVRVRGEATLGRGRGMLRPGALLHLDTNPWPVPGESL